MEQRVINPREGLYLYEYYDGSVRASRGQVEVKDIFLNGRRQRAGFVGGVATAPEYRRGGLVKGFLQQAAEVCLQQGAWVSVLHPFSYTYYRKYGYERVCDHQIVTLPMQAIPKAPRCNAFVRCTDKERNADLCRVYNTLAAGRNLMPPRGENYAFVTKDDRRRVYLSYNEQGQGDSYITLGVEKRFEVNREVGGMLHIYELGYTSPKALEKLFGFVRQFEGEVERVTLHNIAMLPEVELFLRQYEALDIRLVPDCMARIHNVPALLQQLQYPLQAEAFSLRVQDPFPLRGRPELTCGAWRVEPSNGHATVTPLPPAAAVDVTLDIPALSQIVFGRLPAGPQTAVYVQGVQVHDPQTPFFKAFAPMLCGIFEHF